MIKSAAKIPNLYRIVCFSEKMPPTYVNSREYALQSDQRDPLASCRSWFAFPQHEGRPVRYFCGNSLGLQPLSVRQALLDELDHWARHGVEGHFTGERPWKDYHKLLARQSARLVGALLHEVVVMNTLTVNLHLMMASFYRPTPRRYRIIMEVGAFPSDQYAMETQARLHGFDPNDAVVEVSPRQGEDCLRTDDIVATIEGYGDSTALVMFGGVNYYTGQFFDLEAITRAAHRAGAYAGFDLAHAAGNVPMRLHDWGADFAVWCSYKYLSSGPGGPSGVFVHERHAANPNIPRLAGWWGHDEQERFLMRKGFKPMYGAEGWQLSNAQILSFAAHKASLDIFDAVGMEKIREKSLLLTGYLEFLLEETLRLAPEAFRIITPKDPAARGSQLSLLVNDRGKALFDFLTRRGIISDWREPNVIRLSPAPLYVSFEDVWEAGHAVSDFFAKN